MFLFPPISFVVWYYQWKSKQNAAEWLVCSGCLQAIHFNRLGSSACRERVTWLAVITPLPVGKNIVMAYRHIQQVFSAKALILCRLIVSTVFILFILLWKLEVPFLSNLCIQYKPPDYCYNLYIILPLLGLLYVGYWFWFICISVCFQLSACLSVSNITQKTSELIIVS